MERVCITGGAGFIGSALADQLLADGVAVTIIDDFRTGNPAFVASALASPRARLVTADVLDASALAAAVDGADAVFHLQANADVRLGLERPARDIEQNIVTTSAVLEAMRIAGVRRIAFSSTGSVYGEPTVFPTPEDAPFPAQTSLYGASKVAAEGLISSYCHGLGFSGTVFRFVSILGERYTHGHVVDFVRALRSDPSRLRVLGDGNQRKSYLYIGDCVSAILQAMRADPEPGFRVFNLGTDETVTVDESIAEITRRLGVAPQIEHTGGERGWPGDSPLIHLDCTRIRALGWRPQLTIREALAVTVDWLDAHSDVWEGAAS